MSDEEQEKEQPEKHEGQWKDADQSRKQFSHNLSKTQNAPRKKHGTRVQFNFTCSGCGIESSLDYRPKVSLDEILCEDCMQEHEASDRWKIVREKKQMETTRPEFKIDCVECGRTDIVGRLPKPGTDYVCERCKQEQAIPDKSRLEGAESVDGLLKVRRKKKST